LPPQELTADRDRSSLFCVARALHQLQQQWGTIPAVKVKGDSAAAVQHIMSRMRQEQGTDAPAAGEGPVSRCRCWSVIVPALRSSNVCSQRLLSCCSPCCCEAL
jgi:hypothetical protein